MVNPVARPAPPPWPRQRISIVSVTPIDVAQILAGAKAPPPPNSLSLRYSNCRLRQPRFKSQQVHAFICLNHAESVVDNSEVRGERYHIWDTELAGFGLRVDEDLQEQLKPPRCIFGIEWYCHQELQRLDAKDFADA